MPDTTPRSSALAGEDPAHRKVPAKHLIQCRDCRRRSSLLRGTIFFKTQKPLRMWFKAVWRVLKILLAAGLFAGIVYARPRAALAHETRSCNEALVE